MTKNKGKALLWVSVSYVVATVAAILTYQWCEDWNFIYRLFAADVAATIVVFVFAMVFRNSSFYDPYWSVIPIGIVSFLLVIAEVEATQWRLALAGLAVLAWGLRLTWNWWRGWTGLDHEDWRYVDLRHKTGAFYPAVNFLGIMLLPTILVYLGCLPLIAPIGMEVDPLNLLDVLGFIIALGATLIQGTADNQLRRFRLSNTDPQRILDTGLWKYSRHPNYFGEISFWIGIYCFGLAANYTLWWTGIGALGMILLFTFISLPLIDNRMLAKRPHYRERMQKVSAIIPWKPKK